jgi:hypothetical protein
MVWSNFQRCSTGQEDCFGCLLSHDIADLVSLISYQVVVSLLQKRRNPISFNANTKHTANITREALMIDSRDLRKTFFLVVAAATASVTSSKEVTTSSTNFHFFFFGLLWLGLCCITAAAATTAAASAENSSKKIQAHA